MIFSWDEANVEHIGTHGVTPTEAEHVVRHAEPPYPRSIGDDRFIVWGRTEAGRLLQVVFVRPDDEDVDVESLGAADLVAFSEGTDEVVRVIHAMELEGRKKKQARRGDRRRGRKR